MELLIYSLVIIGCYILIINLVSLSITNHADSKNLSFGEGIADVKIGYSDSISVSVVRPRWYGTIEESADSTLYLFNILPLPLRRGDTDFTKIHFFFLISIVLFDWYLYKSERDKTIKNKQVVYEE